jgi:DNA-binding GntR family transcriptional regulator
VAGMTLAKLKRLQELLAGHEQAADGGDIQASLETARAFNAALFEFAGNQEAERLFLRGWDTIHALRLRFGYGPERMGNMREEFRLLIDALRRQDLEAARALIRMHNRAGMEDLLDKLAQSASTRKTD